MRFLSWLLKSGQNMIALALEYKMKLAAIYPCSFINIYNSSYITPFCVFFLQILKDFNWTRLIKV